MTADELRERNRDEVIEAMERLPPAAQVKALERVIVALATRTRDGAKLRQALKKISKLPVEGGPVELVTFNLKLVAALSAAQDDGTLTEAITEAFPRK